MRTTLLVEKNSQFLDFFEINLHTWVGSNAVSQDSAKFAIEYLQKNTDQIDLIITRSKVDSERTAEAIHQFLNSSGLNIPLIVIGESPLDSKEVVHLGSALDIKDFIQASAKALNVTAKDMAELNVPDYFEISLQHFYTIKQPICSVYKNLGDSFELFLEEFDMISEKSLKLLSSSGINHLYVMKNDRLKFVTNINQEIASKLKLDELSADEQVVAIEMSQSLLQEKIARLGITSETIELSQKNMKFMAMSAKNVPNLKHLLARLIKNKTGYLFKHSQILMFVATHLMDQLDWVNEEQRKKLQFIAFFHDIALENSEQAMISSDTELRKAMLDPSKKDLVKKHAQLAASIASQYPNAPIGVEQIIKQHHGMANGLGFSEHYSQNISPMAIVFILAEDLVDELLQLEKDFSIKRKISKMREKYSTQRFKKIIDALESISV